MIGVSWNCRGLGNPRALLALKNLVKARRPHFIFLIETLVITTRINEIKSELGYVGCFSVDCVGRSGGLDLLWVNSITVSVLNYSRFHINVSIVDEFDFNWRCTCFYGQPNRSNRELSWNLLRELSGMPSLPWCVIGDCNDILSPNDKNGSVAHPEWLMRGFRNALMNCELNDLPLEGYGYTWERGRGTDAFVEERWRIGSGNSIHVWSMPWLPNESVFLPNTSVPEGLENLLVSDLFIPGCNQWDIELVEDIFDREDVDKILSLPAGNNEEDDMLIWHFDAKGTYMVKSSLEELLEIDT
ncbi:hypothetical protein DH2020_020745 [Rehmannia glutinosa]|uniref:Endonuclease/exonuclease/phosphatase domain-containing protein n=1 Tax=Rehmannia glutinosa TaxID=99300 RepID=A0ABR0W3Q3_REHGL